MSKENYDLINDRILHASNMHKLAQLYINAYEDGLELTNEEYWDLVTNAWTIGEHNSSGTHLEMWIHLLYGEYNPPPKKYLKGLPAGDEFKVYRGGEPWGLSWTLSKKTAKFFQERKLVRNPVHNPIPQETLGPLSERTIKRDQILWYENGRKEQEVVFIPDEAYEYLDSEQYEIDSMNFTNAYAAMEGLEAYKDEATLSHMKENPEALVAIPREKIEEMFHSSHILEQLLEVYDQAKADGVDSSPVPLLPTDEEDKK